MGTCPETIRRGLWRWVREVWGEWLWPVIWEPLWPSLLVAEDTWHKASVDSKGPGNIEMCLPVRIGLPVITERILFKVWILYIRSQEDFFFFCLNVPNPYWWLCVSVLRWSQRGWEWWGSVAFQQPAGGGGAPAPPHRRLECCGAWLGGDLNSSYGSGSWSGLWHWAGIQPWLVSGTADRPAFGNRIFYSKYSS